MDREIEEFIREESAWDAETEDDDIVEYCEACKEPIRRGEYAMSIIREGERRCVEYSFCEQCLKEMPLAEVLDHMGIDYREGFAEEAIPDAQERVFWMNREKKTAFRRTITTAARMLKEAKA